MNADPTSPEMQSTDSRRDGRRLRSERTRIRLIEAYLEVLRTSPQQLPTAAQIAKQAGCSVRSIFERFVDVATLNLATADYALAVAQTEAVARDVDGNRATRIKSHVTTRALACEKWLPLWRVLTTAQHQLPELKTRVMLARLANIERMRLKYGPELATMTEAKREQLLIALANLISFESWDQLRDCYGLSRHAAEDVWTTAIDRMLPPSG